MWIFIKIVRLLFEIFDIQNFPISQNRFLCRMISRENCFNFFKIWWRCRVCILFECVLRVEEFVNEFQRYLRLKLIQPSFQIVIFRNRERLYVYYRKWKWRVLRVHLVHLLLFFIEVNLQRALPIHKISYTDRIF